MTTDSAGRAWWFWSGLLSLGLAIAASLVLTLQQLAGLQLPGCGPGTACASLAAGPWGSVLGWPISYLGLAWFVGLAVAWSASRRGVGEGLRWWVRVGMIGSVFFTGVMFRLQELCLYCALAHLGNLGLWICLERAPRPDRAGHGWTSWPLAAGFGTLVLVSGVLAVVRGGVQQQVAQQADQQMRESVEQIVAGTLSAIPDEETVGRSEGTDRGGFTGRHPRGPESAPIRLVVFGGYQCPGCRRAEDELEEVLKNHGEQIRVTIRHFPMCRDCNWTILHPSFHDNACRAAWAAEAAEVLGGNEGFWRMHHWLFARDGLFTDEELRAALPGLGFNEPEAFFAALAGDEVRARVQEDIEVAEALGLDGTPLIFVNGVELQGIAVAGNVSEAIEELLSRNLPPRSVASDRGPDRIERLAERWRNQVPLEFAEDFGGWTIGPSDAEHELLLVLDYGHPYTQVRETVARQVVASRDDVRLRLASFPMSGQFREQYAAESGDRYGPVSADGARLAEAVWQLGDPQAFERLHIWLVEHAEDFDMASALQVVDDAGLDVDQVRDRLTSTEVDQTLDQMMKSLEEAGVHRAGDLYLDGRRVTALLPTAELIERLLER